jgi:hypothetical protein
MASARLQCAIGPSIYPSAAVSAGAANETTCGMKTTITIGTAAVKLERHGADLLLSHLVLLGRRTLITSL